MSSTTDQRVVSLRALLPPSCVFEELPGSISIYSQVIDVRQAIINMVSGKDDRLLVVVGPPGPDADAATLRALATELAALSSSLSSELVVVLRADAAMGTPFRILWGSIWDEIAPLVDKALSGQVAKVTDMRLDLARSGQPEESYWTFSYSPVFDDAGGIAGMICVTGETTDRVLAERRQRASDERLDLALSSGAHVGLWDWDVLNDSVRSDARFAAMYGVDPAVAEGGMPIADFFRGIHPDDRDRVNNEIQAAMAEVVAGGSPHRFVSEYRLVQADGTVHWVCLLYTSPSPRD